MKIELNDQQIAAVNEGRSVEVIDPATDRAYVLVRRDQYDQARDLPKPIRIGEGEAVGSRIPPGIRKSQEAFWRDLPQLLPIVSRKRQWVAYHGDERVGFGRTQAELFQECFRRGLKIDDIYVGLIEDSEIPPWGTFHADWTFYEVTDVNYPDSLTP